MAASGQAVCKTVGSPKPSLVDPVEREGPKAGEAAGIAAGAARSPCHLVHCPTASQMLTFKGGQGGAALERSSTVFSVAVAYDGQHG